MSVNTRDDKVLRFIQKCKHLLPIHGRETLQESFNGFTRFNIFDEGLNGYTRPCENWGSPEYLRRNGNDPASHGTYPMLKTDPVTTPPEL